MRVRTPYPRCIFCDERANSREHAIPAWIARRFGLKGVYLHPVESFSFGVTPQKQPISVASHRKRIFCEECNEHFKHLEDRAIPIIEPMARGQALELDAESRATIALWGAKTGIALIAAETEMRDLVPREHRLVVRQHDQPHEAMWVGYAPWSGRFHKFAGDHSLVDRAVDPPRGYRAYGAALMFAQLAFKFFGFVQFPIPRHVIDGDIPIMLRQVWPEKGDTIGWPPPFAVPEELLGLLVQFVPLAPEG